MSTTVNIVTKDEKGKVMNAALTNANPNTADSKMAEFVVALAGLSDNSLTEIQKITKSDLEIPTQD